jgi:hypothetical protein
MVGLPGRKILKKEDRYLDIVFGGRPTVADRDEGFYCSNHLAVLGGSESIYKLYIVDRVACHTHVLSWIVNMRIKQYSNS